MTPPGAAQVCGTRGFTGAGVKQPSALPPASTPAAACPAAQLLPFPASAVAVEALPSTGPLKPPTAVSTSVLLLYVSPGSPPNTPPSLNWTCVLAPPGDVEPPPAGVKHPSALPVASTPVAA